MVRRCGDGKLDAVRGDAPAARLWAMRPLDMWVPN